MKKPSAIRVAAILDELVRQADMDGVVTFCQKDIAAATDVHQTDVSRALRVLAEEGKLTILRRGSSAGPGIKSSERVITSEVQLAEEVSA